MKRGTFHGEWSVGEAVYWSTRRGKGVRIYEPLWSLINQGTWVVHDVKSRDIWGATQYWVFSFFSFFLLCIDLICLKEVLSVQVWMCKLEKWKMTRGSDGSFEAWQAVRHTITDWRKNMQSIWLWWYDWETVIPLTNRHNDHHTTIGIHCFGMTELMMSDGPLHLWRTITPSVGSQVIFFKP